MESGFTDRKVGKCMDRKVSRCMASRLTHKKVRRCMGRVGLQTGR